MGAIITTPTAIFMSILSANPSDFLYGCKWLFSYVYIQIFRKLNKKRLDLYDGTADNDPMKVDFISQPLEIQLESPLEEHELYMGADEIFFYGVNSKSEYLVTRIARNTNHEAEAWIYLKLANGKVYQLRQTSGYQQSCSEKKTFTCGDLQMNYVLPMRTWRIFFNGLLREIDENDGTSEKMVHVKFGLLWRAASDVFDFTTDVNAAALASGLAKAKWEEFTPPLEKLNKALNFYAQCGIIMGNINVEDADHEHNIYLFGERMRFLGDSSIIQNGKFSHVLGHTVKKGSYVHLCEASIANIIENLTFGFLVRPMGEMVIISDKAISLENSVKDAKTENGIKAKFHIQDIPHNLTAHLMGGQARFQSNTGWEGNLNLDCLSFHLNEYKGLGVLINGKILKPFKRAAPKIFSYTTPKVIPFVVQFSDESCQESIVTGGKGSSLGKLTELSKDLQNFIVPYGVVVTTSAYEAFITQDVLQKIKNLEDILYGNIQGDVKEACEMVMNEITKSFIPDKILKAISSCLEEAFSDKENVKFAVRSSATGEDTEQMSAAGQMETFLGVIGTNEILHAVKKCWASQFSYIAVQYKRQNGQIINSPMAVVIQEMIPCDVAGVLFTCDPLTGNPTVMSITANYGLGESVVSASEEPDSIEVKRDADDKLSIKSKIIGAKSRRIVLKDDKGTDVEDISEKERQTCCLPDNMALKLGNLAVKIEKSYRSRRDIEWGFWKNDLYIFQSRPVTCGSGESDFEIEHETDAPLRTEGDYFTVCNVGEVMPGATSQLGLDIITKYFRITFQRRIKTTWQSTLKPRYFPRGICCVYNHIMFYCCDLYERMSENPKSNIPVMVGLFGRVLDDEDLFATVAERFEKQKKPPLSGQIEFLLMLSRLYEAKNVMNKALEKYANYRIPIENYNTSQEMFDALLYVCTDLSGPMAAHMMTSESSTVWNMFIFSILTKARGEVNADVYKDLAQLLTTTSVVESADVPASIDRLASCIAKEMKPEEFKKMDIKDIVEWLQKSTSDAGRKYREFIIRHGHRCLKEFDVRSKTWGTDPTTLIQLLRNLVGNAGKKSKIAKEEDFEKILKNVGLSLGFITRMLLKFLIPQSRQAVQNREATKSLLIKCQDAWRKGYQHLAKLMVSEGRIPDEDLLFFMSLDEIKELLNTRSPKIISRANHRRRHYPVMDKYIFPEIMKGFPKPVNTEDENPVEVSNDENFSMKGIPVSQGVTKAFVRVALTLEEASHLQPGEILLTYSTDIGWSPYFPILAGVVTELGGLISHGAVVSREYGLPCIAGLHGATRQFRTGDYVLLDGNKGILQRLKKPENKESST